jgi:hypothetical protein
VALTRRVAADVLAGAAQAVHRAGQGELRRPQPGHEVAPAHLAPLLQDLEHPVDRREPARHALGQHGLPGEDTVALEQLQRGGVGQLGRARARFEQRRDQ